MLSLQGEPQHSLRMGEPHPHSGWSQGPPFFHLSSQGAAHYLLLAEIPESTLSHTTLHLPSQARMGLESFSHLLCHLPCYLCQPHQGTPLGSWTSPHLLCLLLQASPALESSSSPLCHLLYCLHLYHKTRMSPKSLNCPFVIFFIVSVVILCRVHQYLLFSLSSSPRGGGASVATIGDILISLREATGIANWSIGFSIFQGAPWQSLMLRRSRLPSG